MDVSRKERGRPSYDEVLGSEVLPGTRTRQCGTPCVTHLKLGRPRARRPAPSVMRRSHPLAGPRPQGQHAGCDRHCCSLRPSHHRWARPRTSCPRLPASWWHSTPPATEDGQGEAQQDAASPPVMVGVTLAPWVRLFPVNSQ